MTNLSFNLFKKVVSAGVCLSFFIVNGPLAYSSEANFWSSRRAASEQMRRNGAGVGNAGSTDGQMLLAQLPKAGPLDFGQVVTASADQEAQAPKEPFSLGPKTGDWLGKLVLPYGSVREVYLSPDTKAPFIVHIQDAHGIEEAQRNISSMIGLLAQEPGISLVGLEGASGSFSLEPYRDYPDASITKDIADLFLKKGLIAGPEYAGLTLPKSPDFFGVEDNSLYTANVDALKKAFKGREGAQETLASLQQVAGKLKEDHFSPRLKTFDRHFNDYHSDKEKLATYVRYILDTYQSLQKSRFTVGNPHPLPGPLPGEGEIIEPEQMRLLVKALDEEESLDFKRVELERKLLVERLVGKLSAGQIQDLVAKSVDYRAGRVGYGDYHNHLKKMCVAHGIKFSEWPQLNRYLSYVLLADKIDRNELLNEMEALDRSIPERLARNEKERQLVAVAFDLSLVTKLIRHEMSVTDWTAYESRMGEINRLAARLTALDSSVKVKGLTAETLKPYEDFCFYASRRNNALTDNLLRQMADTQGKSAVLVAGGFHTEGLSALLRKKQVSYVVVTPKISAIPKNNDYLDVMANDPLPLEKQLAGDRIYLAKAIEMANPEGLSARAVDGLQKVAQLRQVFVDIGKNYALTTDSQYKGATVVFNLNSTTPVYLVTNYKGEGSLSNLVTATRQWIVDISKRVMGEDSTRVEDALLASTAIASVALASTGLPIVGAALFAFSHVWKNIARDLKKSGAVPQETTNTPWAAFKANPVVAVAYTTILFGAAFALLQLALLVLGVSIPVSVDSTLAPFMVSEATPGIGQSISLQNILATFLSVRLVHKAWNYLLGGRTIGSFIIPRLTLFDSNQITIPLEDIYPDLNAYLDQRSPQQVDNNRKALEEQAKSFLHALAKAEEFAIANGWERDPSHTWVIDALMEYKTVSRKPELGSNLGSPFFGFPEGWLTVHIHGSPLGFSRKDRTYLFGPEIDVPVTAQEFAELISEQLDDQGKNNKSPILLMSCRSGGELSFGPNIAQQVSKIMNRPVVAPSDTLRHLSSFVITDGSKPNQSSSDWTPSGTWRTFSPEEAGPLEETAIAAAGNFDRYFEGINAPPAATIKWMMPFYRVIGSIINSNWKSLSERERLDRIIGRYAPIVESILFGVFFGVTIVALASMGVDLSALESLGLWGAFNMIFVLSHRSFYVYDVGKGAWVEKTGDEVGASVYVKLAIASLVVHSPLLGILAVPTVALSVTFGASLIILTGISARFHSFYNSIAKRFGLPALTADSSDGEPVQTKPTKNVPPPFTPTTTSPGRLYSIDNFIVEDLLNVSPGSEMKTVVDFGVGFPPTTTRELAKRVNGQARVIGIDNMIYPGVSILEFREDEKAFNAYFDENGDFLFGYDIETLAGLSNEEATLALQWRASLRTLKNGSDGQGHSLSQAFPAQTEGHLTFQKGDFDVRLDEPVDLIRVFNVMIYQGGNNPTSLLEKLAGNLKEGGYLIAGTATTLTKDEYFIVYQKKQGRLIPVRLGLFVGYHPDSIFNKKWVSGSQLDQDSDSLFLPYAEIIERFYSMKSIPSKTGDRNWKKQWLKEIDTPDLSEEKKELLRKEGIEQGSPSREAIVEILRQSGVMARNSSSGHVLVELNPDGSVASDRNVFAEIRRILGSLGKAIPRILFVDVSGKLSRIAANHANRRFENSQGSPPVTFLHSSGYSITAENVAIVIILSQANPPSRVLKYKVNKFVANQNNGADSTTPVVSVVINEPRSDSSSDNTDLLRVINILLTEIETTPVVNIPQNLDISESAIQGLQVFLSDREDLLRLVVEAYQNGQLRRFQSFLKSGITVEQVEKELNDVAQSVVRSQLLKPNERKMPFLPIEGGEGTRMMAFRSRGLPGIILKVPKLQTDSGNPINFEKDILPGYLLAKENLGELFTMMLLENMDINLGLDSQTLQTNHIIVQEELTPLDVVVNSLPPEEREKHVNRLEEELNLIGVQMAMRGVVDMDIGNRYRNYGYSPGGIKGLDVDNLRSIEQLVNDGGVYSEDYFGPLWEAFQKGNQVGVPHARIHDPFEKQILPEQIRKLDELIKTDAELGNIKTNNIFVRLLSLFVSKDVAQKWGMRVLPIEIGGIVFAGWMASAWGAALVPGLLMLDPAGVGALVMLGGLVLFKGLHYGLAYIQFGMGRGEKPVLSISGFAREFGYFLPYVALPFLASNAVLFAAGAAVAAYIHYSYDSKLLSTEKTAEAIVEKINTTTDPTEKMALNAVVGDLMMKGRVSDMNLKRVSGGSAYWTQQDLVQMLMGYGDARAVEALQSSEAKSNALTVLAHLMVQEGQGPGARMLLDFMSFNSWEKEVQETAKTMIEGLTKAGQPVLILHDGTGETNAVLAELGIPLNSTQMDLIDTQEADPGITMTQVVMDYNARTSGKGVPLASTVLVQNENSIQMDLKGFQLQKYSDLSKAIQKAIDAMIAVLQAA